MRKGLALLFTIVLVLELFPAGATRALADELDAVAQEELIESTPLEVKEDAESATAAQGAAETILTYEDEVLAATVTAPAGVLPESARVEVEEIHPTTIELSSATYTAEEGTGTCALNADGTYSCSDFSAFGDNFTLATADGNKQFSKTGVTYTDEPNASAETATDAVTANTAPLAGTIAFTNAKIKTSIELTKVAAKDGTTPLAGATFQLKKADGTLVGTAQTTGSDGKITFSDLQPSTDYVITETSAPAGWGRREDIVLTMNANGTVSIKTTYVATDPMAPTLGMSDANLKYPPHCPQHADLCAARSGGTGSLSVPARRCVRCGLRDGRSERRAQATLWRKGQPASSRSVGW